MTAEAVEMAQRVLGYHREMPISGPRWPDTIGWVFDRVQAVFRTLVKETGPLRGVDAELRAWFDELSKHPDHIEMQRVVRSSEVHREVANRVITPRFKVGDEYYIPTVSGTQEGPLAYGRPLHVAVAHFDVPDESQADWVFGTGTRWDGRVVLEVLQELLDRWRTEWIPEGERLSQRPHDELTMRAVAAEAVPGS